MFTPGITISLISTGFAAVFVVSRFPRYVLGSLNFDLKYGTAKYFLRAGRIYASKRPLAAFQARGETETAYMTRRGPDTEDVHMHRWNNLPDLTAAVPRSAPQTERYCCLSRTGRGMPLKGR